jgi:hypothetical protein
MIRNQVRARTAANQPEPAMGADGQAAKDAAAAPPDADRPASAPGLPRPPWLVRNSRKAAIALGLAILAVLPFAYRYAQDNFGPDPLAGIKLDGVKFDPFTGISEVAKPVNVKPAEVKSSGAKPAPAKPIPAAGPIEPAPKPLPPRPFASPARPVAAAPVGPSSPGVTHTRPVVAASVNPETARPVAAAPDAREKSAGPGTNARADQTVSGPCTEAVAALGFCNPKATEKGK